MLKGESNYERSIEHQQKLLEVFKLRADSFPTFEDECSSWVILFPHSQEPQKLITDSSECSLRCEALPINAAPVADLSNDHDPAQGVPQ